MVKGFTLIHSLIDEQASENMDLEQARINMIKQQIHTCDVVDEHLLQVLNDIPRDQFVPAEMKNLAFADLCISLSHDQVMFCPKEEAQMLQALSIQSSDKVLEIGTGTGYVTALLASLAKQVTSVDIFSDFTQQAQTRLQQLELNNVTFATSNAVAGWPSAAPYDVIIITGSLLKIPDAFSEQLAAGGRLFAVLGEAPAMTACVLTQTDDGQWQSKKLFETVVPRLLESTAPPKFVF